MCGVHGEAASALQNTNCNVSSWIYYQVIMSCFLYRQLVDFMFHSSGINLIMVVKLYIHIYNMI